ncbi:phosphatase PAP2 family protein, partial [Nostoc sp. XA013]|nr:phosphatase PAP2 family protein [Nostoc sp. XA013]
SLTKRQSHDHANLWSKILALNLTITICLAYRFLWFNYLKIAVIAAIGFSRLYLGVHWLTDVTTGYGAGLLWLIACIISLELQQKYRLSLEAG